MTAGNSDALVFFGAKGDLAYKNIFPALQAMAKHGTLDAPVIGVARADWGIDQLREQARRKSIEEYGGGVDPTAFDKLMSLLRYVGGDYDQDATFQALRCSLTGWMVSRLPGVLWSRFLEPPRLSMNMSRAPGVRKRLMI